VPVEYAHAERHYYGVTPTRLVVALAVAGAALAIVLLATGHWPVGLILLGVTVLLVLVTVETGAFRARAGVAADSFATRGRAARRLLTLRGELKHLAATRSTLLVELGDAVYRGDEQATETARTRVVELDEVARQREAEMQSVIAQTQDHLHRRKLEVQPTEMVEIPGEPQAPGEQDPVGPAVIPEPGPAVIPEPGPQGPEEGRT